MRKLAVLNNQGLISNIIIAEDDFTLENTMDVTDLSVEIGDSVIEGKVIKKNNSSEVEEKKLMDLLLSRKKFGLFLKDKISIINYSKKLSDQEVDNFMSDAVITNLKSHLDEGNISTFSYKLSISDVSAFFSESEKNTIIGLCAPFINEEKI